MAIYKLSKYNYFIKEKDNVICYNSLKNKIFTLNKIEYSNLKQKLQKLSEFLEEYPTLFTKLMNWGFVIEQNTNELDIIRFNNKQQTHINRFYWVTINPTLTCNAKCWYCSTEYNEAKYEKRCMNKKTIKLVQQHLANSIIIDRKDEIHIDWFGGEPLLFYKEVMKPISDYILPIAKKHNVKFTQHITTNASLIDKEKVQYFNEMNIRSFQIPLDGDEKRHNNIKKIERINSYNKVIESLSLLSKYIKDVKIILRINYDKQTLKNIDKILFDIPKEIIKNIKVDFQKVWQVNQTKNENISLIKSIEKFTEMGFEINMWAFRPSTFYKCYSDRYHHIAINYDGNVFKCTARDYKEKWRVGKLLEDGNIEWKPDLIHKYLNKAPFENEMCLKCKHLPLCFGPCIQKMVETPKNKIKNICSFKHSEIDVNTYIKFKANKNLIAN